MLKALKRKFILINMLLVFVVMTLVLSGGILAIRAQFADSYRAALYREITTDTKASAHRTFPVRRPEDNPDGRASKLSFSATGSAAGGWALATPWVQVEDETLNMLCSRAVQAVEDIGFWPDLGIAYLRGQGRIAFVNMQSEQSQQQNTLLAFAAVYSGALVLFFLISLGLSKWALKPVAQSWAQQRQFVSDASHELKTPLTVILANLDIQEQESGQSVWLSAARSEGLHMKKLIESMLFLTRSDESRQPLLMARVSLSGIVQEAALAFEALAYENNIRLEQQIEEGQFTQGDADQLKQLVSILLDNAIKYTPPGGVVRLKLTRARDKALLSVLNAPAFIPPDQLAHIFNRFYRADEARARIEGGFGLGLSIAKEIARQHGIPLNASSSQDGTVFSTVFTTASP